MQDTWSVSSLGQSPGRQSMASGRYSCSGDAAYRADGQGCPSARTESGSSNRRGRRRAVDDGRAGHMKNTGPWRWPLPRTRHPAAVAAAAPLPSGRNTSFGCWQSQSLRNKSRCLSLIGFHAKLISQQGSGKIWASKFTFGFGLSPV